MVEFVEKSNLIGWRQKLTTSPANHIRFLLVRDNKFAKWKTVFTSNSTIIVDTVPVPGTIVLYIVLVKLHSTLNHFDNFKKNSVVKNFFILCK